MYENLQTAAKLFMYVSYLRFFWHTFYLGFRVMVERGSVIDYSGKLGYGNLSKLPDHECTLVTYLLFQITIFRALFFGNGPYFYQNSFFVYTTI